MVLVNWLIVILLIDKIELMANIVAIVGRPNVGKSSLSNRLLKSDRLIVSPVPGTTRDAIHIPFEREGQQFELIDTAGLRRKGKVSTPGSKLRAHVLEVLQQEGYIRGFSQTDFGNGRTEFEIELKYFDGEPVIRKIERVSKPGRRVYSSVTSMPLGNSPSQ